MKRGSKKYVAALIVAAGSGKRMGGDTPKQFLEIHGKPILQHTLERFQMSTAVDQIYVVTAPENSDHYSTIIKSDWRINKLFKVIAGGKERYHSVWAGLQALDADVDIVLIHDGVRPFISEHVIRQSVQAAGTHGAVVVGAPARDTVKIVDGAFVQETIDRTSVLLAQTPQTFRKDVIVNAYKHAFLHNTFSTDDSALVENFGHKVAVLHGDSTNIKITLPEDLIFARAFLEAGR